MFGVEIEKLQKQVDQVKLDLDSLKTETSEDNRKNKAETLEQDMLSTKEAIRKELDALKGSTDLLSIQMTKKLEDMLVALEVSNIELTTLKKDIIVQSKTPEIEKEIKEETEEETEEENEEEKKKDKGDRNRIQKQRDGATSKEERKENT
jgi:hypothetical protein